MYNVLFFDRCGNILIGHRGVMMICLMYRVFYLTDNCDKSVAPDRCFSGLFRHVPFYIIM